MALVEKRTFKNQQNETIGPVMPSSEGGDPPNPAETLRTGSVPRRSFSQVTGGWKLEKPVSLYRGEDKRTQTDWNDEDTGSPEDYCQVRPNHEQAPEKQDPAYGRFGKQPGPSASGENKEFTDNGARIYGT